MRYSLVSREHIADAIEVMHNAYAAVSAVLAVFGGSTDAVAVPVLVPVLVLGSVLAAAPPK